MKILYYSPHPHHDIVSDVGYSVHQLEMIKALRDLGHEVEVLVLGGTTLEDRPSYIKSEGEVSGLQAILKKLLPRVVWNTIRDYKRYIIHDAAAKKRLQAKVEKFMPDMIYERSEYLLKSGVEVATERGIPHILEVNAPFVEEWSAFSGKSFLTNRAHRIEKYKMQHTSLRSFVSTKMKDHLLNLYEVPRSKPSIVITNGIDPSKFVSPPESERLKFRESLGIQNGVFVFGFVGSIMPYHGVDLLIRSFCNQINAGELPNSILLVVGGGSHLPALREHAIQSGQEERVRFIGQVKRSELNKYIHLMDVSVMPNSNWYGSPMKLFEYAACGRPIIAPKTAPVEEVFKHLETAIIVENEIQIGDAFKMLFNDRNFAKEISSKAKTQVLENYTWGKLAKRTLEKLNIDY